MHDFLLLAISGLVSGAIYSMMASGLTLLYSTTGIFNFAHGAIAYVAALVFYELNQGLHWHPYVALIGAVFIFAPLLGLLLETLIFRHLAKASETARVVGTIGLVIALPNLAFWILERLRTTFHVNLATLQFITRVPGIGPTPAKNIKLPSGVTINSNQVIVLGAAVLSAAALTMLLALTPLGLRMRAVVDRRDLAAARGVDPARTSQIAWMLGATLAGLAGVVAGPLFGISEFTFTQFLIVSSTAVVLARFRSLPIAVIGGMLTGAAVNLCIGYINKIPPTTTIDWPNQILASFRTSIQYIMLLVALLVMGRTKSRAAGTTMGEAPPIDYLADLTPWQRRRPWVIAMVVMLIWVMGIIPIDGFRAHSLEQGLVAQGLATGLVFLSFTIITGMGGIVSLAQAAFVTAGGLFTGFFTQYHHWPLVPALLLSALVAAALSIVVALPALRLGGLALALGSLALVFITYQSLFTTFTLFQNRSFGWEVARTKIGFVDLHDWRWYIVLLLGLCLLGCKLISNLQHSLTGRAMTAVRTAETAASASGISPGTTKLILFALSAFVAAVGGVFLSMVNESVNASTFDPLLGLFWLTVAVTFGVRRPGAAILAGIVSAFSPQIVGAGLHIVPGGLPFLAWLHVPVISWPQVPGILAGLGAIQLAKNPNGIVSMVAEQNYHKRMARRAKAIAAASPPMHPVAPAPASVSGELSPAASLTTADRPVEAVADAAAGSGGASGSGDVPPSVVTAVADRPAEPAAGSGPTAPGPEEPEGDLALMLRGVRAGYESVEVLHGVTLGVPRARITALLGANGAGKSTLCATAAGLVAVTSGAVLLDGKDVSGLGAHQRANAGILLAPESRGIFPSLSVEDNLDLWLRTPAEKAAVFDRYNVLAARRKLPAGNLSGGEQQMLTLGPLLARPPKVLIVDEPTLGLAPLVVEELLRLFLELRDTGTSLLIVEEKAKNVLTIADHVSFIALGEIVWSGPRADVDEEAMAEQYLGAQ